MMSSKNVIKFLIWRWGKWREHIFKVAKLISKQIVTVYDICSDICCSNTDAGLMCRLQIKMKQSENTTFSMFQFWFLRRSLTTRPSGWPRPGTGGARPTMGSRITTSPSRISSWSRGCSQVTPRSRKRLRCSGSQCRLWRTKKRKCMGKCLAKVIVKPRFSEKFNRIVAT